MAGASHCIARFEERLIEALAVVRDQHVEAGEISGERVEHRRLFAIVTHEELADAEPFAIDAADADQEGAGAGAAGEASGFSVEEGPGGGMRVGDGAGGKRIEKVAGELDQVGNFVAAVTLVAWVKLLGFEVPAEGSFDNFTGEEFFDESGGILFGAARRRRRETG